MTAASKLPYNNMGAEITNAPIEIPKVVFPLENRIIIDWLKITYLDIVDPTIAIERLGLKPDSFVIRPTGGNGYKSATAYGGITVMFDGTPQMGVHVNISGEGCRLYESHYDKNPWLDLLTESLSFNANFPRIDIAHDNVDGSLSLDLLHQDIDAHNVRTRFKRGKKTEDITYHDEDLAPIGKTINLNKSRQSLIFPRFYDKAAQYGLSGHWVRAEIELKNERSKEAIKHLVSGMPIGEMFFSILNNCFSIVNRDDSNKSRCSIKAWWLNWLETTQKLKLTVAKKMKKISDVVSWVQRSVAPSLAMIREHFPPAQALEIMKGIFYSGKTRLKNRHYQILFNSSDVATDLPF
jgi:phage replication initiation protein